MSPTILYEKDGPIATITINRPGARNALTPEMLCRLADAFVDFRNDRQLRVAILTGTGELAFCAGGDLARTLPLLTGAREAEDDWDRRVQGEPQVMAASSLRGFALDKPVISAVNGACLAAGFEILLGTDIRIAAAHAIFGLPEVQRAVIPFAGSMARLPRQIAQAHAMEILLTGRPVSAERALQIGLGALGFGLHRHQAGAAGAQTGFILCLRLAVVGQLGACAVELRLGGVHFLGVDTVVDAHQRLAGLDPFKVMHQHFGDVAVDLRRQHGDLAAHIGVVGAHHRRGKGADAPAPQNHQNSGHGD